METIVTGTEARTRSFDFWRGCHALSKQIYADLLREWSAVAKGRILPWFLVAKTRAEQAGSEASGAADESEDDGRIFGRIVAPGLGAQGKCCGKHQCEGKGESRLF
jgi:hypothetical protein